MYSELLDKFKKSICKSYKSGFCEYANEGLIFSQNGVIKICSLDDNVISDKFIIQNGFNGINFDAEKFKSVLDSKRNNLNNGAVPQECLNCFNYNKCINNKSDSVKTVCFSHWKCCFLKCVYCQSEVFDDISKFEHYDISPVIEQLLDKKIISSDTKIIFSCGDAVLHPEFDKIIYFFINYGMKDIEIYTSAQRYCYSISEAMDKKILSLNIALDSASSYIYEKIKGVNKFDIAIENIKRYLLFDTSKTPKINIIYTLVEGINDNKQEILNWFLLSKGMGVRKLSADIDINWYNKSINNIPDYLEEIILFIKQLSEINNFNIEFTPKLKFIYNRIQKRKN